MQRLPVMVCTALRNSWPTLAFGVVAVLAAGKTRAGEGIVVEKNLTYGKVGGVELKLDLARPKEGSGPFPAIVCIHGGAWAGGKRSDHRSQIEKAARKGYVAVAIDYRLTEFDPKTNVGKVPFPAQLHDCKCAVRWLRSVADRYHVDPDRIGVTGGSAGGHLALLVGFVDEKASLEGNGGHSNQSSRVQAVVNYCGPTDLTREYHEVKAVQPFLQALCGGTPESAAEAYRAASPITYISKEAPPVLTLHGDKDDLVPVSQAKLLDDTMKAAGLKHELLILEGQGHAIKSEHAEAAFWEFLERHLKRTGITIVRGRVTLDGKPLKKGCVVNFVPKSPNAELCGSLVEDDGKFVAVGPEHLGMAVGEYAIQILPPRIDKAQEDQDRKKRLEVMFKAIANKTSVGAVPKSAAETIVPFKYWSESTSKLKFKVKPGENTATFRLKS